MTPDAPARLAVQGRDRASGSGAGVAVTVAAATAAFLILAATAIRIPTLGQPLVEAHSFRQTQTAWTALIYAREGIDLLHPKVPVLGPPWELPFEFPIYQAIASLVIDGGVAVEPALRTTSLAFFMATAVLLWRLVRDEAGETAAAIALGAFLFSPFALLFSRTATIEFVATAPAVAFVWTALRWDRTGSRAAFALAIAVGVIAALAKVTTAVGWILPAAILLRRHRVGALILVGVPMFAGLGWTAWTDAIKAASPATAFLTSGALRDWNVGPLELRLNPAAWVKVLAWSAPLGIALLPLAAYLVRDRRVIWAWLGLAVAIPLLAFLPLYTVHDYYMAAIAPAVAGLIGGGLVAFIARRPSRVVLALVGVVALSTYALGGAGWLRAYVQGDPDGVLPLAAQIRADTQPDDQVVIFGRDWSPAIHFYADRRGYAVPSYPGAYVPDVAGYVVFDCPAVGEPGQCVRRVE